MMNLFHGLKELLATLLLSLNICSAQTTYLVTIKPIISDDMRVSVDAVSAYRVYEPEISYHTIDFLLTNKSENYIGEVSFIQYELNEKNEVLFTTFWTERDGLRPHETRLLSTYDSSLGKRPTKIVWSIHRICTEKGTWRIDLKALGKAIPRYPGTEPLVLPAAEFEQAKCPSPQTQQPTAR